MTIQKLPLWLKFILGVSLILSGSLVFFYWLMRPPMEELRLMAQFLTLTAVISILGGYGAYRMGWIERSPSLRWTLLGTYVLAGLLTFLNVWVTAQLMFASYHDLQLAIVLLVFAVGIAVALGTFLANTLTQRISRLEVAARSLAAGDLGSRAEIAGSDEIARLALTFNEMAARLEEADRKQRRLENLRRDLVAWASHDLQTPLTSIQLQVEALSDGLVEDPETVQRYLHSIQRETRSLSRLIDDLFQVAKMDAGGVELDYTEFSLPDLLCDALDSFSAVASKKEVELSSQVAPEAEMVFMDPARMGRVMNNLIANALRHTPQGGRVCVTARREPDRLLIEVSDTGEGISPDDMPHVFERFYRGEKSRSRTTGGAGLGLAIVLGIVEAHSGTITIESEPGNGTIFRLQFPG
jgi:signal transduction histidine kinase